MKTQEQMYRQAQRTGAAINLTFMEMVSDPVSPLTKAELEQLIEKRPALWGRFSSWLDILK